MGAQLTPTQIMFISACIKSMVEILVAKVATASEDELKALIANKEARIKALMAEKNALHDETATSTGTP